MITNAYNAKQWVQRIILTINECHICLPIQSNGILVPTLGVLHLTIVNELMFSSIKWVAHIHIGPIQTITLVHRSRGFHQWSVSADLQCGCVAQKTILPHLLVITAWYIKAHPFFRTDQVKNVLGYALVSGTHYQLKVCVDAFILAKFWHITVQIATGWDPWFPLTCSI